MANSFDIFLDQGGGWDMLTFLTEPPLLIESSNPVELGLEINTIYPHCYKEGDRVLIFDSSGCVSPDNSICVNILRVTGTNSFIVDTTRTNSGGTEGFVAAPIDLRGYYFKSSIRNRDFVSSSYPVLGAKVSGKAGDNRVLICGNFDIAIGDIVSIPSMGINRSKVLNILVNKCEPEPDPCCPVGVCKALVLNSIIQTTKFESNDLILEGGDLMPLNVEIISPECGYIHVWVDPHTTIELGYNINTATAPVCNKDLYYQIGKYNIFTIRGYGDKVPSHYCLQPNNAPFNNSAFLLGEGNVFIKPTYVDFSTDFPQM